MNMTGHPGVNRSYKDRLFRFIFNDKKELLTLYNALNNTNYTNPEEITIHTLDNIIYMGMKNDISFLVSGVLNLYEHQSTWNPNMPYRNLVYTVDLLKGFVEQHHLDVYGSVPIKLPTPQAVVFFNGEKDVPERSIIRLSDSFKIELDETYLEFKTLVLNINYGKNKQLMEKCKRLKGYAIFVDRVRSYAAKMDSLEKAVDRAIDECIEKGVLSDILRKHRGEVLDMILTEYDEQAHIANEKRWSFEEGERKGLDIGIRKFIEIALEEDMKEEKIIQRLEEKFSMESSRAKRYLETVEDREVPDMILTEYDEQVHIANEKRWSFEEGERKGLDIGIRKFVKISIKNNMTEDEILENLTVEYALEPAKAKEYLETVKEQMEKEKE